MSQLPSIHILAARENRTNFNLKLFNFWYKLVLALLCNYYAICYQDRIWSRINAYCKFILFPQYLKVKFFTLLTPKAEYRLDFLFCSLSKNTSDLGLGGLFGLRMTLTSSPISSSNNLESDDVEACFVTEHVVVVAEVVSFG